MDYEKKYKEAIQLAKAYYGKDTNTFLDTIFPELKESEDERIREELWEYFHDLQLSSDANFSPSFSIDDVLAWLEKQKEKVVEFDHLKEENPLDDERFLKGFDTGREVQKIFDEQKPAERSSVIESEYDKGYREGHRFGLRQTQEYMIPGGRTFSGLIPCWVNAPSELQPAHRYHGKNLVIMHENNGGFRCVCIDDEKAVTFHLPENTSFGEGWRKRSAEWSEEDEKRIKQLIYDTEAIRAEYEKKKEKLGERFNNALIKDCDEQIEWLKSLRPQPHWKPSEEQMATQMKQEQQELDLEKAALHVYESWMGGTMDDVRRDMDELGKVLNARKEE